MPKVTTPGKLTLIASDEKQPKIALKAGMKLNVVSVKLADATLKKAKPIAARLCGGTNTCLALIEIDEPGAK